MPRYFFDVHNGRLYSDTEGMECADFEQVRQEAMRALPEIARDAIRSSGNDLQAFTVCVRDEANASIYTATLTFSGIRTSNPAAL
ncbi:hypothetical protein OKC48_16040 [Methylorubrum extorquens]|jgi:hypothetical protein|uniref:DUF6894 family protein n=1 Tax=Methylorubrum extorquens TaxID=408 RepID=UPI0022387621|nr:hypothetical protein [Methylorubrum extorquens]UYW24785.1 hypothetical protein OKC48_16040 [Methylorubrum extorquens]